MIIKLNLFKTIALVFTLSFLFNTNTFAQRKITKREAKFLKRYAADSLFIYSGIFARTRYYLNGNEVKSKQIVYALKNRFTEVGLLYKQSRRAHRTAAFTSLFSLGLFLYLNANDRFGFASINRPFTTNDKILTGVTLATAVLPEFFNLRASRKFRKAYKLYNQLASKRE